MIEIKSTKNYVFYIDDIDADLLELKWNTSYHTANCIYARRSVTRNQKRYTEKLHRIILSRMLGRDLLPTEQVDHINGNTFDNRRCNLRLVYQKQNTWNYRKPKNNTSGFKGVSWNKSAKKWTSNIKYNRKRIFLGYYLDPEEAHEAYCRKAIELFGEYARFE